MILLKNIREVLTLEGSDRKDGRNLLPSDLSILQNCSIIFDDKIKFIGDYIDIPKDLLEKVTNEKDLSNYVLTPEIVDSHTHLIFGGNRAKEYSMRLNGADYQEIAKAGGGILESTRGTNSLDDDQLYNLCYERVLRLNSYGVGTIEIKSGYGLSFEMEYRLSQIIHKLKINFGPKIQIKNTYMAAHAVPKDSTSKRYIDEVCIPLLDKLASEKIIDAVDIFHEEGYFDTDDVTSLLKHAINLKLPVKTHADEFKDNKGALLASGLNALSTDHLLKTSIESIRALSKSNTVATLLPGTGYFLGKDQANAREFLDAGVKVAIASDYNPGSCHCDNVLLLASIAAPNYKLNMAELWSAITLNASHALGLEDQGSILIGKKPRFTTFNLNSIDEITYNWGRNFSVDLDSI
jgi:imidazolonepropionase